MTDAGQSFLQWVDSSGLALSLVTFALIFFMFKVWPWWIRRIEKKDADEVQRHAEYMKVIGEFSRAMNAVNTTMSQSASMIGALTDRIDEHHHEVMAELRSKR